MGFVPYPGSHKKAAVRASDTPTEAAPSGIFRDDISIWFYIAFVLVVGGILYGIYLMLRNLGIFLTKVSKSTSSTTTHDPDSHVTLIYLQ